MWEHRLIVDVEHFFWDNGALPQDIGDIFQVEHL
jgi:hypothetical protein